MNSKLLAIICILVMFFNSSNVSYALENNIENFGRPYTILKQGETKTKTLFILSRYDNEYSEYTIQKMQVLKDIVSSHWNTEISVINVNNYRRGMIDGYDKIFFMKEDREPVSFNVLLDLSFAQNKTIMLSGFNHETVGFIMGAYIPVKEIPITWVDYKNVLFSEKGMTLLMNGYDIGVSLSQDIHVFALAGPGNNRDEFPMAFSFDNSRFFGDENKSTYVVFPFVLPSYYNIDNHTIVFLDLLYEIFWEDNVVKDLKPALLRLEDINAHTYFNINLLKRVYNFLKGKNIPFHIAYIERYINPKENKDIRMDDTRRFSNLINKMVGEGLGILIQHGYTHQIGESVSGVGFEFWDEKNNSPLENDSEEFVLEKIAAAQEGMRKSGLPIPDIWETPHYALSDLDNKVINTIYPIRYEHIKNVGVLPFVANIEGTIYIPENLGFISNSSDKFIYGQTVEDINTQLKYLSVFRNHVASFFWHPWRDENEIKKLVEIMQSNGYTFVSAYELLEEKEPSPALAALSVFRENYKQPKAYIVGNLMITLLYIFFVAGCLFYIYTIIRLKKYIKIIDIFNMSLDDLRGIFNKSNKKFPFFGIFVPARNEGYVIENTLKRLASLDYPKDSYKVFIIVDERELDDNVEITTKEVVNKVGSELNNQYGENFIKCIEVPKWYSGTYGDKDKSYGKSTKGRALNFALQTVEKSDSWEKLDMIGVLDADGRLHPNVLKEAAYNRVIKDSKILQGPVFQFSNFNNVSMTGIAAGIELAIHHLTELPSNLLKNGRVQFLAGTNYFVDRKIISEVGGWNQDALVEDAELALRIYVNKRVVADWIGSPEIEQTPASFSIYRKQRKRWVRGHLDLIKTVYKSEISINDKLRFFWKIFVSQFRFVLDIGFPIIAFTFLFMNMFLDLGMFVGILSLILLGFAVFMWDLYGYLFRKLSVYIDPNMNLKSKTLMSIKLFIFSPIFMFIQSIPRIQALISYVLSAPENWYKTERTKEIVTS